MESVKPSKLKILEKDVLRTCRTYLDYLSSQDQLFYTRVSSGAVLRGGAFSPNKDMVGMEDLQVYLEKGVTLYIEVKSPDGVISQSQRVRREKLEHFGHWAYIVRDVKDLERIMRKHGVRA